MSQPFQSIQQPQTNQIQNQLPQHILQQTPKSSLQEELNHKHQPQQTQIPIQHHQPLQQQDIKQNTSNSPNLIQNQAPPPIQETQQTIPIRQDPQRKHQTIQPKSNLPRNSRHSVQISSHANENQPSQRFQVKIHRVDSRQSLSQHGGEKRYQSIFTKSQMNIPIEYKGNQQEEQRANKEKLNQLQSANCSVRPSEQDDFYVQYLEQKWAKKQQEQNQMNLLISNLQKDYQTSHKQPKSLARHEQPKSSNQQCQIVHHQKTSSIPNKKAQFKVKKVQDKPTTSTINSKTNVSTSSKLKPLKVSESKSQMQSKSQVIAESNCQNKDNSDGQQKPYKYTRTGKKNHSNFQNTHNKVPQKQSIYKNEISPNIHIEISLGNSIEMMSHILQDKCYNTQKKKKARGTDHTQNIEGRAQGEESPSNNSNVRKIIKRSPYGILEIEVKDKKNNAKITNLRILKPKEMIQLKKIPNLGKGNKQNMNVGSKSVSRLQEKQMNQKEGNLGQGGLPLLNCNNRKCDKS